MIVCPDNAVGVDYLPSEVRIVTDRGENGARSAEIDLRQHLRDIEKQYLDKALAEYGNVRDAAKSLGMASSTFVRRRKQME